MTEIKFTVLIVEDEENIGNFISTILKTNGYKPIIATTGTQAIQCAESYCPDIILLDLGLPDMDGIDVISEIRKWAVTPIIVISARNSESEKVKALDAGADDYITKPFGNQELLARIRTALRHRRQPMETETKTPMYHADQLKIDFDKRRVFLGEEEVRLTQIEYKLVSLLAENAGKVITYESIIKEKTEESFEDYVINQIDKYRDHTINELCDKFEIQYKERKPKNLEAMLTYRMLGIKGNQAEEFEKANIVIKTIRIKNNNKIKENMSFPTFKFKELTEEEWDDSTFGNYLRETKFLFVVYKFDDNNELRLKGCQFWNMPYNDLEQEVRIVWEKTKQFIIDGLKIEVRDGKNYNNLPKASENRVCHVRPHGRNANDTYELPDGRRFPKQSFWLNNSYILSQLDKRFIE